MGVRERVRLCMILEKMEQHKEFSRKLEIENKSSFHGEPVDKERGKIG